MTTVTVDKEGKVGLPEEILFRSHIQPGARLVALAHEGKIVLIDKERFWQRVEQPGQKIIVQFQRSLAQNPQASFFGGLTFEEYAALSGEEEQALWDRLSESVCEKYRFVDEKNIYDGSQ